MYSIEREYSFCCPNKRGIWGYDVMLWEPLVPHVVVLRSFDKHLFPFLELSFDLEGQLTGTLIADNTLL